MISAPGVHVKHTVANTNLSYSILNQVTQLTIPKHAGATDILMFTYYPLLHWLQHN